MRRPHNIALQVLPQDISIAPLHASRHRLADPRECLVTIKAAKFDDLAIEFEAMVGELGFAETDHARVLIDRLISSEQRDFDFVKIGMLKIPQLDAAQWCEMNCMHDR